MGGVQSGLLLRGVKGGRDSHVITCTPSWRPNSLEHATAAPRRHPPGVTRRALLLRNLTIHLVHQVLITEQSSWNLKRSHPFDIGESEIAYGEVVWFLVFHWQPVHTRTDRLSNSVSDLTIQPVSPAFLDITSTAYCTIHWHAWHAEQGLGLVVL